MKEEVLGFTINKYIGLSYFGYTLDEETSQDIWQYYPITKTWKAIEDFPMYYSQSRVF